MKKEKEMVMETGADKKHTAGKLKRKYKFVEKVLPDGSRETLVVECMLHHRKFGTDVIVSCNLGAHPYEDA